MNGEARETSPRTRSAFGGQYWVAWLSAFLFFGGFYSLLGPLPLYLESLGWETRSIGFVLGAFGISSLLGRLPAGIITDRWGQRPMMFAGACLLAVGSFLAPLFSSVAVLFALRVAQALGYVAFTTASTALVASLVTDARRGGALAIFGAAANGAMAIVPGLSAYLLVGLPVAAPFVVAAVLAFCSGVVVLVGLTVSTPVRVAASTDGPGPSRGVTTPVLPTQSRPRNLTSLLMPLLAALGFGVTFGAFLQLMPLLVAARGLAEPGYYFSVYGVAIICTRLVLGPFLDRTSRDRAIAGSLGVVALGSFVLAGASSGVGIIAAVMLIALGSGVAHPSLIAAHTAAFRNGSYGSATSLFYLAFDLGIGGGTWVLSSMFGPTSMWVPFVVAGAFTVVTAAPMLANNKLTAKGLI